VDSAHPAAGTAPAKSEPVTLPRYQTVRLARLRELATVLNRKRVAAALPFNVILFALLFGAGVAPWRIGVIGVVVAINIALQVKLAVRTRRHASLPDQVFLVGPLIVLGMQFVIIAVTGGLASPLLPVILTVVMSLVAGYGRSKESGLTLCVAVLGLLLLAIAPAWIVGPPLPRPWHAALAVWGVGISLFFATLHMLSLIDVYQEAGERIERLREDALVQALERACSLEAIGAKLGHVLKNPLASIKGLAQLLERQATKSGGDEADRARERLQVMIGEVTRLETIVREYLSFSRPLEDLEPEPLQVAALVDEVLAVAAGRAEVHGVELAREGDDARAEVDGRRLREALLNLVANAVEATPPGGRVTVRIARRDGGIEIAVQDTGRGLGPAELARVGTPFYTTREGGTGLGVVLARTVVVQHGGQLEYESAPGRGTLARVTLPVRSTTAAAGCVCAPRPAEPVHG
jgi:signal transduction histidine kinase